MTKKLKTFAKFYGLLMSATTHCAAMILVSDIIKNPWIFTAVYTLTTFSVLICAASLGVEIDEAEDKVKYWQQGPPEYHDPSKAY